MIPPHLGPTSVSWTCLVDVHLMSPLHFSIILSGFPILVLFDSFSPSTLPDPSPTIPIYDKADIPSFNSTITIPLSSQHHSYHHPQSTQYRRLVLMDQSLSCSMFQAQAHPSLIFYLVTSLTLLSTLLVHVQYDSRHRYSATF